jgi:hypothetical protein
VLSPNLKKHFRPQDCLFCESLFGGPHFPVFDPISLGAASFQGQNIGIGEVMPQNGRHKRKAVL